MNKRIKDFKELGLGLFIHYGLYSKFEKGEWFWEMNHLTCDEYFDKVTPKFKLHSNFKKFLPIAKEAGFNYSILTSKHHDGFALYDSNGNSKYDVNWLDQPIDIVDDFIVECEKNNIKPFLYYATMEWNKSDFEEHLIDIYKNIEFLLNKYKNRIFGFWFDGNWSEPNKDWKLDDLYLMIREKNPNCIIINNTGLENKGKLIHPEIDSVTYEQGKIDNDFISDKEIAFEVCYPINDHWGYANKDFNYKSFPSILSDWINIRNDGGNLLLNIGLDSNGNIGNYEKSILELFKKWNSSNKYFLTGLIRKIDQNNKDLLLLKNETTNKKYIIVKNLKSGAHIDNIHYGNKKNKYLIENVWTDFLSIVDISNNENIDFSINNNNIEIFINSFEYGMNQIFKVLEVK